MKRIRYRNRKIISAVLAAAVLLSLAFAAAPVLAAREEDGTAVLEPRIMYDEPSVHMDINEDGIVVTGTDGAETSFGAAQNVRVRQTADMSAALYVLSAVADVPQSLYGSPHSVDGWRGLYENALAAGTAQKNAALESLFADSRADAGRVIQMVLESLDLSGVETQRLVSAGGSVESLGFCVDGMAAVLQNGAVAFVPVESLANEDGSNAAHYMPWIATKAGGCYDAATDTLVLALPAGEDCLISGGRLSNLTVDDSVSGDVTLERIYVEKTRHYGKGMVTAGDRASLYSVEAIDISRVRAAGGEVRGVTPAKALALTVAGNASDILVGKAISVNANMDVRQWSISDTSVAHTAQSNNPHIKDSLNIVGAAAGGVYVTARADGQSASVYINVQEHSDRFGFFNAEGKQIEVGETFRLMYGYSPYGAYTGYSLDWETSDPGVAAVKGMDFTSGSPMPKELYSKPNGTVLGVGVGTATITARTADGRLSASYVVKVNPAPPAEEPEVYFTNTSGTRLGYLALMVGERYQLSLKTIPPAYFDGFGEIDTRSLSFDKKNLTITVIGLPSDHDNPLNAITIYYRFPSDSSEYDDDDADDLFYLIYSVDLPRSAAMQEGEESIISPEHYDSFYNQMGLKFKSSDSDVAELVWGSDSKVRLVAKSPGTATVSMWGLEGVSLSEFPRLMGECTVTVRPADERVELSAYSLGLAQGESARLTARVFPEDLDNKNVTWASGDEKVATVATDGTVTAIEPGRAKITATAEAHGKSGRCTVTVTPPVEGVTLDKNTLSITKGETGTLVAAPLPRGAVSGIRWSSSNEDVATVENGAVKGESVGTATVTATTEKGGFTASCEVNVLPTVDGVELSSTALEIQKGEAEQLTATILPTGAVSGVTWKSSSTRVAEVDSTGRVTANVAGTATITATTVKGGFTASCKVTVKNPVTSLTLSQSSALLTAGGYLKLNASVQPSTAVQTVYWSSSNGAVATVDEYGGVDAVGVGSATVTAASRYGGFMAACEVTVRPAVESLTVEPGNVFLYTGDTYQLKPSILPDGANKQIAYSGNDGSVATVDANGLVSAVGPGRMTVTLRSEDVQGRSGVIRGKTQMCFITVKDYIPVIGLSLDRGSASLLLGNSLTLNAEIMPIDATVKDVVWTSSNPAVASVSGGVVSGAGTGTAVITATSADKPEISASCTVNVYLPSPIVIPVERVVVSPGTWRVGDDNPVPGDELTLTAVITPSNATHSGVTWRIDGADWQNCIEIVSRSGNTMTIRAKASGGSFIIYAAAGGIESENGDTCVINTIEAPPEEP